MKRRRKRRPVMTVRCRLRDGVFLIRSFQELSVDVGISLFDAVKRCQSPQAVVGVVGEFIDLRDVEYEFVPYSQAEAA